MARHRSSDESAGSEHHERRSGTPSGVAWTSKRNKRESVGQKFRASDQPRQQLALAVDCCRGSYFNADRNSQFSTFDSQFSPDGNGATAFENGFAGYSEDCSSGRAASLFFRSLFPARTPLWSGGFLLTPRSYNRAS